MSDQSQDGGLEKRPFRFEAVGHSDTGCVRKENEDAFRISYPKRPHVRDGGNLLAIVADGVGGHAAGKVASQQSVEVIANEITGSSAAGKIPLLLQESIEAAHAQLKKQMQNDSRLQGMGTTCTVAWLSGREAYVAQVGDSRAYLVRNGHIIQITEDQTVVQSLVKEGVIDEAQAAAHPERHLLSQALGVSARLRIDMTHVPLQAGDRLVLCSDGLHGLVTDAEIAASVSGAENAEKAVKQLIELSKMRGGYDNVTVVIIHTMAGALPSSEADTVISRVTAPDDGDPNRPPPKKISRIYLLLLALAAAGLLYYLLAFTPKLPDHDKPAAPRLPAVKMQRD